jgi:hypothetical protein
MLKRAVLFAIALCSAATCLADDDPLSKLLASLEPKDARVQGRSVYGIHVGRRSVGVLVVEVAPTTSGTASYHALARGAIDLEEERSAVGEEGLLDRGLAPVSLEEREREGASHEPPPVVRQVTRATEGWSLARPQLGKAEPVLVHPTRPLVHGLAARHALLRALDPKAKATLVAQDVDAESGAPRDIIIDVAGLPETAPDEKPLWPVTWKVGAKGEAWRFLLDSDAEPAKRVVRFARADRDGPTWDLAKDEASARADLPAAPRPPAGSPRACVLDYLEACERRDAKKLDPVIDWPALHRKLAEPTERLEEWKKRFLERFATDVDEDHAHGPSAAELIPRLREEPVREGALDAIVRIEGETGVFKLIRDETDKPWRIVELP